MHLQDDTGEIDAGVFAERAGEAANLASPSGAIQTLRLDCLAGVSLRRFLGEVGRLVFFFGAHGCVGLDVEEGGGGALVLAIGELP